MKMIQWGDAPIRWQEVACVARGEAIKQVGDWFGPPVNLASRITEAARPDSVLADKKADGNDLTLVLADGIGRARVVTGVDPAAVRDFLSAEGAT